MELSKVCLTCKIHQPIKDGCYIQEQDLFQCKDCILRDIKCLDCGRLTIPDQSLLFDEGGGTYWSICQDCLRKSHTLLILLKDQSRKSCKKMVKKAFKLADVIVDKEIEEEKANAPPEPPPKPKPVFSVTEKEKFTIQNACEMILGVQSETLIVEGRDKCQEHMKFQTSDYAYEFVIGCHDALCGYIDVFHSDASFDLCYYRDGKVTFCWHGKSYDTLPAWIPSQRMYDHCMEIIRTLGIRNCKKWH
jgi:hypothetical protein